MRGRGDSPLLQMTTEERLVADFRGTGLTTGPHPMAFHREHLQAMGITRAIDLAKIADGARRALPVASSRASGPEPPAASSSSALKTKPELQTPSFSLTSMRTIVPWSPMANFFWWRGCCRIRTTSSL